MLTPASHFFSTSVSQKARAAGPTVYLTEYNLIAMHLDPNISYGINLLVCVSHFSSLLSSFQWSTKVITPKCYITFDMTQKVMGHQMWMLTLLPPPFFSSYVPIQVPFHTLTQKEVLSPVLASPWNLLWSWSGWRCLWHASLWVFLLHFPYIISLALTLGGQHKSLLSLENFPCVPYSLGGYLSLHF